MRTHCIYAQVMVQMFMRGWNMRQLAEETDISYVSLRRKLRGESPFTLEEAFAVRDALQVELSLDALFEKRRMAG
ncbi:MAG: helix-turn-helix transcriptional regulator [Clostridia bacterium]|nr:helix-turn-helix transcriptional regulator [Clostridia bacterium]